MRIVSTDVELAGSNLECSLDRGLHSSELPASHKWAEVIHAGFDLPAGIHAREALLSIDLHQREVSKRFHFSISLWKEPSTFQIERVSCFKRREGPHIFNPAC